MTELLDIATVVVRDTINVRSKRHPDGKLYELVNLDDLGPFEHQTIVTRHAKMTTLSRLERKMTAPEQRDLKKTLGDLLKLLVIGLEPAVLAEMETPVRAKIVTAWALKHGGAAEGEEQAGPSTTAGSARGSKRSTAATKKRGSTSPATR